MHTLHTPIFMIKGEVICTRHSKTQTKDAYRKVMKTLLIKARERARRSGSSDDALLAATAMIRTCTRDLYSAGGLLRALHVSHYLVLLRIRIMVDRI